MFLQIDWSSLKLMMSLTSLYTASALLAYSNELILCKFLAFLTTNLFSNLSPDEYGLLVHCYGAMYSHVLINLKWRISIVNVSSERRSLNECD